MARHIAAGVDIGTYQVKAVIAEEIVENGRSMPKIIGTGLAESKGVERGYITNSEEAAKAVRSALALAESQAGVKVKRAFFSAGGVGLAAVSASGSLSISRADMEIVDSDLDAVLGIAEGNLSKESVANRRIINSIPLEYKIDGKAVWGRVEGLKAHKIEVKALFLTALEHHLQDIITAAELAGVEVIDMIAGPVAASFIALSKKHKKAGAVLVDIGAETLSVVVYENDNLISLEVFATGSVDLTHDIALGLKTSLEEAEHIKRGEFARVSFSKKKLDEILAYRLGDYFEIIDEHLKKIGRDGLLPAGIVLTGGGSGVSGIREFASEFLELHAEISETHFGNKNAVQDNIWAPACGLAITGFTEDRPGLGSVSGSGNVWKSFKKMGRKSKDLISQFLP